MNIHIAVFSLLVLTVCVGASSAEDTGDGAQDAWVQKRNTHKPIMLTTQRLLSLGDMSDMDYFKTDLLAPFLKVRVPGTQGNREVQGHIKAVMKSLSWTVEEDTFNDDTPFGEKQFSNIIAVLDPSKPRRLTFACHFDSKYFQNIVFIGATDSAVPCAMMLDIAKSLNRTLWANSGVDDVTLQFLFLDGEEAFEYWTATDSLYGARHLANKMSNNTVEVDEGYSVSEIDTIDVFILLDLIGEEGPLFRNWFQNTTSHFERLAGIERRAGEAGMLKRPSSRVNKYFLTHNMPHTGVQDDHIPFLQRGVPILHMVAYPFPALWHTDEDTEEALHYGTIEDLLIIFRVFVCQYLHLNPLA